MAAGALQALSSCPQMKDEITPILSALPGTDNATSAIEATSSTFRRTMVERLLVRSDESCFLPAVKALIGRLHQA